MEKEKLSIAKIADKIKIYEKSGKVISTNFLDPSEIMDVENLISKLPNCCFGGFESAERKIILIGTEEIQEAKEWIAIIRIESKQELSHREILGSVLGLGIKRDVVGDILIKENKADIIVTKEISKYVLQNLGKIGRERVNVQMNSYENLLEIEDNTKEIKTTIASLRLDAIISSGIGISRENSSKLIENQKVKLNYKLVENPSKKINEGDKISIRGYGRIELIEIVGKTKKDRIRVVMKRY